MYRTGCLLIQGSLTCFLALYSCAPACYQPGMKTAFLTALFCVTSLTGFAATPSAEQVLSDAKATAASENKAIFCSLQCLLVPVV